MSTTILREKNLVVSVTAPPEIPGITRPMTYEEYMASPEEMRRYDIVGGWKIYRKYGESQLPNPTRVHQRMEGNIYVAMRAFETATEAGQALTAPVDVLITRSPRLKIRQPDVLFIGSERLAANPPATDPAPLSPAPELVVEIVSPSDRPSVLAAKIADYRSVDVREVWVVRSQNTTVELVRLSEDEIETIAIYERGQNVVSLVFPGLAVAVDAIFTT